MCNVLGMSEMDIYGGSFFFFKQKTAYEMLRSLVGSEMCIRDSCGTVRDPAQASNHTVALHLPTNCSQQRVGESCSCLLYTSDAADDPLCVDLGGTRIIKKKIQHLYVHSYRQFN